ncbi:MAG TPA: hypothetical protein VLD18_13645, partial [Verrucomicrobiae bacterium]|nr:hypothetical protein [Verrucomicrobiae bacterium]
MSHLCAVTVSVNDLQVFSGRPEAHWRQEANEVVLTLTLPVPEKNLVPDWNRIAVRFTWEKPAGTDGYQDLADYVWSARRTESHLQFHYERKPLVPELRRFPTSLTEESLLRPAGLEAESGAGGEPVVALLIPGRRRDVHLRAVAVLGACLGKPGHDSPSRLGLVEEWESESSRRNGLLVGRVDELNGLAFSTNMQPHLAGLAGGEGFIGELITGQPPRQRRWILISGGDDEGMEKALLTLAHAPTLLSASPNPAIVHTTPLVTGPLEAEAQPGPVFLTIQDPKLQPFTF